jgi:Phage integrase, N-terminal SAM-like domain
VHELGQVGRQEQQVDSQQGARADAWTVARWLRYWLTTRTSIRPSTLRSYTEHVELHLIPHLGRVRLGELTGRQVADMFQTLAATNNRWGRPPTQATLHRIRATLRSALNAAIREGLLRDNPARHIELPSPRRPHAQVWTDPRVAAWRERGERSTVAVWTVKQLAAFFGFVADDRLYAMWWLIALRGLRRGEARRAALDRCGPRRPDHAGQGPPGPDTTTRCELDGGKPNRGGAWQTVSTMDKTSGPA